jgi:transcriptional regulator with XRE-family HTH domain
VFDLSRAKLYGVSLLVFDKAITFGYRFDNQGLLESPDTMAAAEKLEPEYSPMAKGNHESEEILRLMENNRWSQRALARELGISQPALHKLLNGKTAWKMSLYKMALDVMRTPDDRAAAQNAAGDLAGGIIGIGLDKDLRRRLENIARREGQITNGRPDLAPLIKMAVAQFVAREEASFRDKK